MEGWKLVVAGGVIAIGGMAVGAALFGAEPAVAQTTDSWRDCIIVRQESLDVNSSGRMETVDIAHTVLVPSGYVPVGGGGMWDGNNTATVVLCRH